MFIPIPKTIKAIPACGKRDVISQKHTPLAYLTYNCIVAIL
jgi:hypothetical protein